MKYVSFYDDGDRIRPGLIDGDCVNAIACDSLVDYIALSPAERRLRHTIERLPLADIRLAAPVHPRKNVFCVGRNYLEHAKEGARALGRELKLPEVPTFFSKAPTAIAGPDEKLNFEASVSQEYDWEAELAVVIGKRIKDATEENALDAVFGYTCLNDITARDLQRAHQQWLKGKSLDQSCPMGPWIVDAAEVDDPHRLQITLRVNGAKKQEANTGQMIFRIPRLIAQLSRGMTLEPGDVIATGTPDGVGFARTPPEFFQHGDVVEISIQKIGTLSNAVFIT
ncbi:MAG TPA: fumarylacetoacetate hydrolase family protein [Candidatus Baltobacteraceae bacterium]|nr:fumarylacetoacetate hydrolase family protein [Candidatus Baltobacteraceae bacterium]